MAWLPAVLCTRDWPWGITDSSITAAKAQIVVRLAMAFTLLSLCLFYMGRGLPSRKLPSPTNLLLSLHSSGITLNPTLMSAIPSTVSKPPGLVRELGVAQAAAIVVGTVIGSG